MSRGDDSAPKAISRGLVPTVFHIEKRGTAPCRYACPAHQRAQGYIALIRERRYEEAYRVIKEDNPFPSICGRICDHRCEEECSRNKVDEPVSIMALKRFVADWAYGRDEGIRDQGIRDQGIGNQVAIVGSGPAGLTAAQDLVRLGYGVTVFEALPVAGGMMRVGVPEFRLPRERLQWEIDQIVAQGVELRLNHRVESLDALFEAGYEAVFLATGAHRGRKLPLPGADHPDVLLNTDFLLRVNMGERVALGERVLVLGGGNVAIDVARIAARLGAREVQMACLESRPQMPAHSWEIEEAEAEGIAIHPSRTFKEVVIRDGRVAGVRCVEVDFRGFVDGQPDMDEIPGTEHILPADTVIFAIGQAPDLSYLDGRVERTRWGTIVVDPDTMATDRPGVFAGGDVVTGTAFVIDAVAAGHKAARSIVRYLQGGELISVEPTLQPKVELSDTEIAEQLARGEIVRRPRVRMPQLPLAERLGNFRQVDLGLSEEQALAEAERCLTCGICSECLECVQICQPQAIDHEAQARDIALHVGAVIWADGSTGRGGTWIAPDDVVGASATATHIMLNMFKYRERPSVPPVPSVPLVPSVSSVSSEVAVFLCCCGDEISDVVDLAVVGEALEHLPGVALVQEVSFACHEAGAQAIERAIAEGGLGYIVLAACSCCSLDQICYSCTSQRMRCKGNLLRNPRLEFVNIREQCAFVHRDDPAAATAKAMGLVAAAVARARLAEPWLEKAIAVETTALIVGRGPGAEASAEALTGLGFNVVRAEAEAIERIRGGAGDFAVTVQSKALTAGAIIMAVESEEERARLVAAFGSESLFQVRDLLWAPVESRIHGIFLADSAMAGWAATARAVSLLSQGWVHIQPNVARVDATRCRGCGDCVAVCGFGALRLVGEEGLIVARVSEALCQGCGTCLAHCPTGAIVAGTSSDRQIEAMLEAMLT